MDFVVGWPCTRRQYDSIWVIIDKMRKSALFIPVKATYSTKDYAKVYLKEIVRTHGVSLPIISDSSTQFTSHFWKAFQSGLGTKVKLCAAFHPQTDCLAERNIQTLKYMFRSCVIDFKGNWYDHLSLIESAYTKSYHSNIFVAPYEALYGKRCRSPIGWFEVDDFAIIGHEVVCEAVEKFWLIRDRFKTSKSRQKSYADNRNRDLDFMVGDLVYLKLSPMKGVRFGKNGKHSPWYVVPYEILKCMGIYAYELKIPIEFALVHSVFHLWMLKKCIGIPVSIIPLKSWDLILTFPMKRSWLRLKTDKWRS